MRMLHISDTHGSMRRLSEAQWDVVVHSGDMMPNLTRGDRSLEVMYQNEWLDTNAARLKHWIGDKPFLFCSGNHDFVDPVPKLREFGIDAYSLTNQLVEVGGVSFYGFPYINKLCGEWNWELDGAGMWDALRPVRDLLNEDRIGVLVAHSPPLGCLDNYSGSMCGSRPMADLLSYGHASLEAYLCGHIHEANGFATFHNGICVSNAATTQHIVEV